MAEDYRICKLDNMTHAETLAAVANSKVFIDFGTHPGKDRIAREAAILHCIPIVHYAGAAMLKEDVPLPDYLKPQTELFLTDGHIKNLIKILISNHQSVLDELSTYREQIDEEKAIFYRQTKDFLAQSAFI